MEMSYRNKKSVLIPITSSSLLLDDDPILAVDFNFKRRMSKVSNVLDN